MCHMRCGASGSLHRLPFQGSRLYHSCAVRFLMQTFQTRYADLGLGIRASAHLPHDVFRAPLDAIEEALPPKLRKIAINSWIGSLMCSQVRYKW